MRKTKLTDRGDVPLSLPDEIRRRDESRYDHRSHGVLLVALAGISDFLAVSSGVKQLRGLQVRV